MEDKTISYAFLKAFFTGSKAFFPYRVEIYSSYIRSGKISGFSVERFKAYNNISLAEPTNFVVPYRSVRATYPITFGRLIKSVQRFVTYSGHVLAITP